MYDDVASGPNKKLIIGGSVLGLILLVFLITRCTGGDEEQPPPQEAPPAATAPGFRPIDPQLPGLPTQQDPTTPTTPIALAPPITAMPQPPQELPPIELIFERGPQDQLWYPIYRTEKQSTAPRDNEITEIPTPTPRPRGPSTGTGPSRPQQPDTPEDPPGPPTDPSKPIDVVTTGGRQRLCDEVLRFTLSGLNSYGWKFFIAETSPPNGMLCRATLIPDSAAANRNAWVIGSALVAHLKPLTNHTIACRPIINSQQCRPQFHKSAADNSSEYTIGDELVDGILPVNQTIIGVSTSPQRMSVWVY